MSRLTTLVFAVALLCGSARAAPDPIFLLAPPETDGPVVVQAGFELRDINEIDDLTETFQFSGILTLA